MRFSKFLQNLEHVVPKEYHGKFLNYRQLKLQILYTDREDAASRDNFFEALKEELGRVNRVFNRRVAKLNKARKSFKVLEILDNRWMCLIPNRVMREQAKKVLLQCFWCRQYALINATGLRKILKKYDKIVSKPGSLQEGAEFMKTCWEGTNLEFGTILHSPVLQEVSAAEGLYKSLYRLQIPRDLVDRVTPYSSLSDVPPSRQDSAESRPTLEMKLSIDPDDDRSHADGYASSGNSETSVELFCPICANVMYHPIGLSCGHTLCEQCVLTATGMLHVLGPMRAIVQRVPSVVACPFCRQEGVFQNAMQLKELDQLAKTRHPDDWKAQDSAERGRKYKLLRKFLVQKLRARD